jgi:hypothetical protein
MSNFVKDYSLLLMPVLAVMLWVDFKFSSMLFRRVSSSAAVLWSIFVTAGLAGFLLWLLYALSIIPAVWRPYHQ